MVIRKELLEAEELLETEDQQERHVAELLVESVTLYDSKHINSLSNRVWVNCDSLPLRRQYIVYANCQELLSLRRSEYNQDYH